MNYSARRIASDSWGATRCDCSTFIMPHSTQINTFICDSVTANLPQQPWAYLNPRKTVEQSLNKRCCQMLSQHATTNHSFWAATLYSVNFSSYCSVYSVISVQNRDTAIYRSLQYQHHTIHVKVFVIVRYL